MAKRKLRTFDQMKEGYYREHPDEIESYLKVCFKDYAKDGATSAFPSSLWMIAHVKRIFTLTRNRDGKKGSLKSTLKRRQSRI